MEKIRQFKFINLWVRVLSHILNHAYALQGFHLFRPRTKQPIKKERRIRWTRYSSVWDTQRTRTEMEV